MFFCVVDVLLAAVDLREDGSSSMLVETGPGRGGKPVTHGLLIDMDDEMGENVDMLVDAPPPIERSSDADVGVCSWVVAQFTSIDGGPGIEVETDVAMANVVDSIMLSYWHMFKCFAVGSL